MSIKMDTQEILSEINIHNKYATYVPEKGRREVWPETCDRLRNMHIVTLTNLGVYLQLRSSLESAMIAILEKKILPSMRSLQFAGRPIFKNPVRLYNCAFLHVKDITCFSEIMYLLLSGCGVGFSVQTHHIAQLPKRKGVSRTGKVTKKMFEIPDSVEGWSEAINFLIQGYLGGNYYAEFDYSLIRPQGSVIEGISGKAPGSDPLRECLENIRGVLSKAKLGAKLRPIQVHDIICYLADAVLAGGIRRSATISLFSKDDKEMLECKTGNWWENNIQRARANNSVVLERDSITFLDFWKIWGLVRKGNAGEPGITFTNNKEWGMNPCAEISLEDKGFCNLVEINTSNIVDNSDFHERVKSATFLATIQSTYTDFSYLRKEWKENVERDRLIGVSLTGIADGKALNYGLSNMAGIVSLENARVASILDIPLSKRQTTVKPSGNSSVVLKTSSGVHARHAPYYWRRIRINKTDPMKNYLESLFPQLLEEDIFDPKVFIVKVAVKSPKNALMRTENPLTLLNRIKKVFSSWIVTGHREGDNYNNISATVSIKRHQWIPVGLWLWFNRNFYTGISVLPYDGGTYDQTPYENCTKQDYEDFVRSMGNSHMLFLENCLEEDTHINFEGEVACSGGGCEVD